MTYLVFCLVSCVGIEREAPSSDVLYSNFVTQEKSDRTETGAHLNLDSTILLERGPEVPALREPDFASVPGVTSVLHVS